VSTATAVLSSEEVLSRLSSADEAPLVPAGRAAYRLSKRALDIVLATAVLVAVLPVMLAVALAIKLTSRGPVFFRQLRAGLGGRPFMVYKFRTMRDGADRQRPLVLHLNHKNGPIFKIPEDPRLTRIGRFLRRSSLDELPQLFHCITGQMSLVGPRPLWVAEAERSEGPATMRTMVKPGLTGLWQISGRSELTYEQLVLLDLYYIRRRSMSLDLLILIQTIPAVITCHGAY